MEKKIIAVKNLSERIQWGMEGRVIDRYEFGPHKYIVIEFENGEKMTFGDPTHPLISCTNCVKLQEELEECSEQ